MCCSDSSKDTMCSVENAEFPNETPFNAAGISSSSHGSEAERTDFQRTKFEDK